MNNGSSISLAPRFIMEMDYMQLHWYCWYLRDNLARSRKYGWLMFMYERWNDLYELAEKRKAELN